MKTFSTEHMGGIVPRGKKEDDEAQGGIDWKAAERAAIVDEAEQETGIPPSAVAEEEQDGGYGPVPDQGDVADRAGAIQGTAPSPVERVDGPSHGGLARSPSSPHNEQVRAFGAMLQKALPQFRNIVPKGVEPQWLVGVALSAIERTPGLLECTGISVLRCILMAGQLGLDASGLGGLAYMVPFPNRKTQKKEAQLIIGYKGMAELARRGPVAFIHAQVVYDNEQFKYEINPIPRLYHQPYPLGLDDSGRGEMIGAYAVAVYKDPALPPQPFVISRKQIERVRDHYARGSKDPDSPWVKFPEDMAKKTAIRGLAKMLPQTPQLNAAIELEERQERGEPVKMDGEVDIETEVVAPVPTATAKLAAKIKKPS